MCSTVKVELARARQLGVRIHRCHKRKLFCVITKSINVSSLLETSKSHTRCQFAAGLLLQYELCSLMTIGLSCCWHIHHPAPPHHHHHQSQVFPENCHD